MAVTTLLDIAKANGSDAAVGLIEEVQTYAPEVMLGAARTIKGLSYKTLIRTALPTTAFRNANEGVAASKSTWENRVIECFTLNPRWECDKAVADRYEDGAQAFIALEADGIMRAAMLTLGSQFYYGVSNDAKGFPGVPRFSPLSILADQVARPDNAAFARNMANRLWFAMLGRGLVHPLDLHHPENPPSHPELLELLAGEFAAHGFDIRWLLSELALTRAYQRSSLLAEGAGEPPAEEYRGKIVLATSAGLEGNQVQDVIPLEADAGIIVRLEN